jgi:hypothetical protein
VAGADELLERHWARVGSATDPEAGSAGSIGTAPMRRLRGVGAGRPNSAQAWQGAGAARCAGTLKSYGAGYVSPKNRLVPGNRCPMRCQRHSPFAFSLLRPAMWPTRGGFGIRVGSGHKP